MNPLEMISISREFKEKAPRLRELYDKIEKGQGSLEQKREYLNVFNRVQYLLDKLGQIATDSYTATKILLKQVTKQMQYINDPRYKALYDSVQKEIDSIK